MRAIAAANEGHVRGYGDDAYTHAAISKMRAHLGEEAEVFFVFNGTGANVSVLQALMPSYGAVICAQTAHINVDECGAPEKFTGGKLVDIATPDGKLTPAMIDTHAHGLGDQHHVQPSVVSITQSTEMGTVYTPDEVRAIAVCAHGHGMTLHMDGARIGNAAASLGLSLRDITANCGVDALSFGGTKNGLMGGEAVVFFRPELARSYKFIRKQSMQLASKMRFISVQFDTLLTDDLWRRNASHANAMARRLAHALEGLPDVWITQPVQANAVFAVIPGELIAPLQAKHFFYVWDEARHEVRWMTSFDTSEADVDAFAASIQAMVEG
jgi:threonine aldolase